MIYLNIFYIYANSSFFNNIKENQSQGYIFFSANLNCSKKIEMKNDYDKTIK